MPPNINERAFRALEAVAVKDIQEFDPRYRPQELAMMSWRISKILEIVTPLIAADALRSAADEIQSTIIPGDAWDPQSRDVEFLRARADELEEA